MRVCTTGLAYFHHNGYVITGINGGSTSGRGTVAREKGSVYAVHRFRAVLPTKRPGNTEQDSATSRGALRCQAERRRAKSADLSGADDHRVEAGSDRGR